MKIMAAIAPSQLADAVIDQAVFLANACSANLTIMSVGEVFRDNSEFLGPGAAQVEEKLLDHAKAAVQRAKERAEAQNVHPTIIVESGASPEDNILKVAEEQGINMIVIGHRGRSGLSRYIIGSVAARVVAHAPCSVLVVRSESRADLSACAV